MRDLFNGLVFLVLGLYVMLMVGEGLTYQRDKAHCEAQIKVDSLILIELRRYNDILEAQAERIARTPFMDKDSIGVGFDGYLYNKYYRKYKITDQDD